MLTEYLFIPASFFLSFPSLFQLEPLERQWMLESAKGNVPVLIGLLDQEPGLATKKVGALPREKKTWDVSYVSWHFIWFSKHIHIERHKYWPIYVEVVWMSVGRGNSTWGVWVIVFVEVDAIIFIPDDVNKIQYSSGTCEVLLQ